MSKALYPWLQTAWQRMHQGRERLSHALLLSGTRGIGKYQMATELVRSILCADRSADGFACGRCKSCQLIAAGTHPDFQLISPVEEGKAIVVDQVRDWIATVTLRPHIASMKATLIYPADAMNHNAANSLLKMLEEPPLGNVLVLVADHPERLPATVRSRCRWIKLPVPEKQSALQWLKQTVPADEAELLLPLAHGAPLYAQRLHEEEFLQQRDRFLGDLEAVARQEQGLVEVADRWQQSGALRGLQWFQGMLADMIKYSTTKETKWLANPDLASRLHALTKGLHLEELYQMSEKLAETGKLLGTPLDQRLLLEDGLVCWLRLFRQRPGTA